MQQFVLIGFQFNDKIFYYICRQPTIQANIQKI